MCCDSRGSIILDSGIGFFCAFISYLNGNVLLKRFVLCLVVANHIAALNNCPLVSKHMRNTGLGLHGK